jgi:hypothetical protein
MKPWLTIWTNPRLTIRGLADKGDDEWGLPVALLAGALYGCQQFTLGKPLAEPDLIWFRRFWPAIAISSAFAGATANLVYVYVGGGVFPWVGRFFGARAEPEAVRTALCWSQVPVVAWLAIVFLLNFPLNVFWGNPKSVEFERHLDVLLDGLPDLSLFFTALGVLIVVLILYWLVILVVSLSEVFRVGIGRAIGTVALAAPISSVLAILVTILFRAC